MSFSEEEFNHVRFIKCTKPFLIRDESKTEEENKNLRDSGYPYGYNDLMDFVFPPEDWEENGKTWRRVASTNLLNLREISLLEDELWSQMKYWQINDPSRLCQIRRELYMRYFDELIRQVCIINVDIGELFIRIRDEFNLTMETYENIYKDSVISSTKKLVIDGRGAIVSQNEITSLEHKNNLLNRKLFEANRHLQCLTENTSKELETLKAANDEEINFFKKNLEALKEQYNMLYTETTTNEDFL